jgi:hypothetical protein
MRKFPQPKRKNNRYLCPACGESYNDRSGYRYHYEKKHPELLEAYQQTQGIEKPGKEVMDNAQAISKLVISELPKLKRLTPIVRPKGDLKEESWVLQLSDMHYGQLVKGVEVGGLSEYSPAIAKERLDYLAGTLVRVLEYHTNPPKELVIIFGGDIIDGSVLRGNQQSNIEFGAIQQVIEVHQLLSDFIIFLSGYFPKIRCYGVYGNHARMTANPKDSHPSENFDLLIYDIIKARVNPLKDISLEYTKAQHMIIDIQGYNFWCEHGDTVRGWMGLPFYGANREKGNINAMMGLFKQSADYLLMSHHHNPAKFNNIYINGSFPGGDLYSIGRIRAMGVPSQNLLGVNAKHGVVWDRAIRLIDKINVADIKIYK